jgi:hypothetical protein
MILPVEKLEDFLHMIEGEDDKATIPIFVDKRRIYSQDGSLAGEIVIQYQFDTNMIVQYRTREGIEQIKMPSTTFITALEAYQGIDVAKRVNEQLKDRTDHFEAQLQRELIKAMDLLKAKGFQSLINSIWVD